MKMENTQDIAFKVMFTRGSMEDEPDVRFQRNNRMPRQSK